MIKEALHDLLEVVEAAIESGDWKVDGACDPDFAINRAKKALKQPTTWNGLSNHDIDELIPRTDLSGDYGYQDMYAVARIVEYRLRMQNHG